MTTIQKAITLFFLFSIILFFFFASSEKIDPCDHYPSDCYLQHETPFAWQPGGSAYPPMTIGQSFQYNYVKNYPIILVISSMAVVVYLLLSKRKK